MKCIEVTRTIRTRVVPAPRGLLGIRTTNTRIHAPNTSQRPDYRDAAACRAAVESSANMLELAFVDKYGAAKDLFDTLEKKPFES